MYFPFILPMCHHVDFIPQYCSLKQDLLTLSGTRNQTSLLGILQPYNCKSHAKFAVVLYISVTSQSCLNWVCTTTYHSRVSCANVGLCFLPSMICFATQEDILVNSESSETQIFYHYISNPSLPLMLQFWNFHILPLAPVA